MEKNKLNKIQEKLNKLSRKWWFFALFILLQFIAVPLNFASKNFSVSNWMDILTQTFRHALLYRVKSVYSVFQIITIALIILLFIFRNKVARYFTVYAGITFLLQAIFQNVGVSEKYGLSFITVNIIMFPLVGIAWFWEAAVRETDFNYRTQSVWKYVVALLAFFAFWAPKNLGEVLSLKLGYIITSGTTFGFCLMVPVYLAILFFSYPRVNMVTMRITSIVGIIIGLYNMWMVVLNPQGWWHGVLHFPLLSISIIGLYLSLKKQ
jgi:hypothetical protein